MLWFCSNNFSASSSSYSNKLPYQSLIDSNNNNDEDEKTKIQDCYVLFVCFECVFETTQWNFKFQSNQSLIWSNSVRLCVLLILMMAVDFGTKKQIKNTNEFYFLKITKIIKIKPGLNIKKKVTRMNRNLIINKKKNKKFITTIHINTNNWNCTIPDSNW